MVRMRGYLWVILILGLLWPGAPPAAAGVHCGPPLDWQKLSNLTRRTVRTLNRPDPEKPREISAALRSINWARMQAWQNRINRPDISHLVAESVDDLRNYASTGTLTRPGLLLEWLDGIDRRTATICVEIAGNGADEDGGFVETAASPAGFGMSPNGETLEDYVRLSLLPVIIAAFGVVLKVTQMLMQLVQTQRYSRRACRVTAELHIGAYVIPGAITVLGLHGCRFTAANDEARALLSVVAQSGETRVLIGSIRLPSDVVSLHDNWAAIRFEDRLGEALYKTILERSDVRARLVRLPRLSYNIPEGNAPLPDPAPARPEAPGIRGAVSGTGAAKGAPSDTQSPAPPATGTRKSSVA